MRLRAYKPRKPLDEKRTRKAEYMSLWYYKRRDEVCAERRRKYAVDTNWVERAAKRKESSRRNSARLKASYRVLVDGLKNAPCLDCGGTFPPECMDFDHVRGKKCFRIGQMGQRRHDDILSEIDKCDLVCANCHRTRTRNRTIRGASVTEEAA